jgi:hypothetical protein
LEATEEDSQTIGNWKGALKEMVVIFHAFYSHYVSIIHRIGVGAVSICGSEKTIVWRDDQVPPGLTYPIGASGAIVSDQMDEDGSEFLCCFLAKDKRMVVFELSTRTVVVELQMTTKLNYWRFLPPEAGEDTLCFMLVTPVGGFHWMPLDESPRPRQVWKRGPELQVNSVTSIVSCC